MSQTAYIREDQADIRLTVDGVSYGDGNSWATYAGGARSAAGAKTRPGGMGKERELGGPATRSDVTITIQNSDSMISQHAKLESRIGKGDAVITVTYLDQDGNVRTGGGAQFRVTGKLKEAALPGQNYENATTGMYTVVVSADEQPA